MKVLITGGGRQIRSTIPTAPAGAGPAPAGLDHLEAGRREFVGDRVFYAADIADRDTLRRIVDDHPDLDATIHCAARIVVPESVAEPYAYYRDNVTKSLELFDE